MHQILLARKVCVSVIAHAPRSSCFRPKVVGKMAPTTKTFNKDSGEVLTLTIFNSAMNKLDDKLENLVKTVDENVTVITKYIDNEVTLLTSRISKTEAQLHDLVSEGKSSATKSPLDCIEQCIVISNLKAEHDEDQPTLRLKLANLFECMDYGDVAVIDCKRMGRAPCPLVKVALSSGDRVMMLKKKSILNRHTKSPRGNNSCYLGPSIFLF